MTTNRLKKTSKESIKSDFWKNKFLPYFFLIYIIILNSNTFKHGFVLDDDIVYSQNSFVLKGFNGIGEIFSHGYLYGFNKTEGQTYRPITLLSFAIENQFFNKSSSASHVIQVLLYAIACFISLKLLLEIFNKTPLLAYIIAFIFATHPIHSEVVANIKSRDEILSFLFIILMLRYLLKYLNSNKLIYIIFSIITFVLALLSKESSFTIVFVIPFFFYLFSSNNLKKNIIITSVFVIVSACFLIFRTFLFSSVLGIADKMDIINNTIVSAGNKSDELATTFYILGYYLKLLIIPYPLSYDYSYNFFPIVSWSNIISILSLLAYLFIGIFALIRIKKKHIDGFGFLFFLALFSISTNVFVKIGATLGERFLFTPSFGFILAITYLLWNKFCKTKLNSKFIISAFFVILIYSVITYQRNKDWKSNFTLFESALSVAENSSRVQASMGSEYRSMAEQSVDIQLKNNYYEKAVDYYQKSINIYPKNIESYYNIGVCYQFWGKMDLAKTNYISSLKILPTYINSINNLGTIYFNQQKTDSAMSCFMLSFKLDSTNATALANIGAIYHNEAKYIEAINYYEKSLFYDKSNRVCKTNLIKACQIIKDTIRLKKYEL